MVEGLLGPQKTGGEEDKGQAKKRFPTKRMLSKTWTKLLGDFSPHFHIPAPSFKVD